MSLTLRYFRASSSGLVGLALAFSLAACGSSDSGGDDTTSDTGGTTADTSGTDGVASDTTTDGKPSDGTATDTTTTTDGSGSDTASSGDTSGVSCGAATCKVGEVCCVTPTDGGADEVCATSCSDGGLAVSCDGPEDCPSLSANTCCGTIEIGPGTPPSCPITGGSASCVATCTTKPPSKCDDSATVRLCHATADCTGDGSNKNCCTFTNGSNTATFCVNDLLKLGATSCAP